MPLPSPAELAKLSPPALQQLRGFYPEASPAWLELTEWILGKRGAASLEGSCRGLEGMAQPSKPKAARNDWEHQEQVELFRRAREAEVYLPEIALLHAVPNWSVRTKAAQGKMVAEGLKPGVPDVHLPLARGDYVGLWIEMKAEYDLVDDEGRRRHYRGELSDHQQRWAKMLTDEGHLVVTCYSAEEAWGTVLDYLARSLRG